MWALRLRGVLAALILPLAQAGSAFSAPVMAEFTKASSVPIEGAEFSAKGKELAISLGFAPSAGDDLMVVKCTGLPFISGRFSNLKQGQEIGLEYKGIVYHFVANYYGGSGNDLVLVWQRRGMGAWGANSNGELGNNSTMASNIPLETGGDGALAGKTLLGLSGGGLHAVAVCSDGTIAAWGSNKFGQLGNGGTTDSSVPVRLDSSGVLAGKTVVRVSAGARHTLALCSDGTIASWGRNADGALGNGSKRTSNAPVQVTTTGALEGKTVVQVSAGGAHSLALCSDGTVVAWGANSNGQLGNRGNTDKFAPVRVNAAGVLAGKKVIAVAAGLNHSLAVCSDGSVAAWGANASGQLGNGVFADSNVPVLVKSNDVLAGKTVVAVAAGSEHNLALCMDGAVVSWGAGDLGQLGYGNDRNKNVPVLVDAGGPLAGKKIVSLSAGGGHSLALCADGMIAAWGNGFSGALGNNGKLNSLVPVVVDTSGLPANGKVKMIEAANHGGLAVSALAPGADLKKLSISVGSLTPAFSPEITSYLVNGVGDANTISFTPTPQDAAAVKVNGTPVASGIPGPAISLHNGINVVTIHVIGGYGEKKSYTVTILKGSRLDIELGSVTDVPISGNEVNVSGLSVNLTLAFAPPTGAQITLVRNTGLPFISGEFTNLAQGQQVDLTFNGITYKFLANYYGGTGNDLVLEWAYRDVYAWGDNTYYQLGVGNYLNKSLLPLLVNKETLLSGRTVMKVAAGASLSMALCTDGTIMTWGRNSNGQMGNGTWEDAVNPAAVSTTGVLSDKHVVDISTGGEFCAALCSDGTVAAWGYGFQGQLGNNASFTNSVPVLVDTSGILSGRKVVSISAGYMHTLALCSDGTVVSWGYNNFGQLGDGSVNDSAVPVMVAKIGALTGKSVVAVQAGISQSFALCSDGTVAAWGANSSGELGDGTTTSSEISVKVIASGALQGKTVRYISTKGSHSLALTGDGVLVAWGRNDQGQIGDGGTENRLSPIKVSGAGNLAGRFVSSIAGGFSHSLALCADGAVTGWGSDTSGELGGGIESDFSPTPVALAPLGALEGKAVTLLAAGNSHNVALAAAPLSSDSTLSSLVVNSATLDFGVAPTRKDYSACVAPGTSSVTILPTVSHSIATMKVNGVALLSGTESQSIPLSNGAGVISVSVIAEDGTSNTYTISIITGQPITAVYTSDTFVPATYPALDATGLSVGLSLAFAPEVGTDLTVVNITGLNFIKGQFANLVNGQEIKLAFDGIVYRYEVDYHGGTGNDLVLHWLQSAASSWGDNAAGQLGDGTQTPSSVPLAVLNTGALAGRNIHSVSIGKSHSLALCSDGTLVAWGDNRYGQLGNGTTISSLIPVLVDTSGILAGKTIVSVSAGIFHSLAVCSDGTVAAWGYGRYGQLGNGGNDLSKVPVKVIDAGVLVGKTVVAVSAGNNHSLGLCSDGTVTAWGQGPLGTVSSQSSNVPVLVDSTGNLYGKTVVSVSASGSSQYPFCLALCSDGSVAAWGNGSLGQLGSGDFENHDTPVLVDRSGVLTGKKVTAVSAGDSFSLAVCDDGTVAAWGDNSFGQLGINSKVGSNVPVLIDHTGVLSGRSVTSISAANGFGLAGCSDGSVVAWGSNSYGQLGDNSKTVRLAPVLVSTSGVLAGSKVRSVEVGGYSSMVVSAIRPGTELSGLLAGQATLTPSFSPEINSYYTRVGNGTTSITISPTARDASPVKVNGIKVGSGASTEVSLSNGLNGITVQVGADGGPITYYTLAILRGDALDLALNAPDGIPFPIGGYDFSGVSVNFSLGFAPSLGTNFQVLRNGGTGFITGQFANLAQGQAVDLAFDGSIYHFVANYYGGTGNDLVLEWAHRSIAAWGYNSSGQLGITSSANVPLPVAMPDMGVLSGKTVVSLAAGASHSVALCADGTLASWGGGANNLGAGGITGSSIPIAVKSSGVLAGKRVVRISAAAGNNLAVCADGSVVAWGSGSYGQLGNGGTASTDEPVAVSLSGVLAGKSVTSVAVGGGHSLALCSDGSVLAWGYNNYGQLGDGTTTNRLLPVLVSSTGVLAGKKVVAISAGLLYSLALCSDGTLATWGDDSYGQLGTPSSQGGSSVPKLVDRTGVLAGETVVALSSAAHSTPTVLCASGKVITWGLNDKGQRGNPSFTRKPDYVNSTGVLSGRQVVAIASGGSSTTAICSDGGVATWGDNSYAQLGVPGLVSSLAPITVNGGGVFAGKKALFGAVAYHCLVVLAEPDIVPPVQAASIASLSGSSSSADPDGDGIPNLMEYVLHGDPNSPSTGILPSLSAEGGNFVFHFNRLAASANDTTQVFQYSTDMITWTPVPIASPTDSRVTLGVENANGDQAVSVKIPKNPDVQMFGRLKVSKP